MRGMLLGAMIAAVGCGDSGTAPRDADTDGPSGYPRFELSAYVLVVDQPSSEDAETFGRVWITETPEPGFVGTLPRVLGARVTIGGVEADDEPFGDQYQTPLDATLAGAMPDGTVEVIAEHPRFGRLTGRIDCPSDFAITEPIEGAVVVPEEPLEVRWAPAAPERGEAAVEPWDPEGNRLLRISGGGRMNRAEFDVNAMSAIVIPTDADEVGYSGYAVTVSMVRESPEPRLTCSLARRVHLARD